MVALFCRNLIWMKLLASGEASRELTMNILQITCGTQTGIMGINGIHIGERPGVYFATPISMSLVCEWRWSRHAHAPPKRCVISKMATRMCSTVANVAYLGKAIFTAIDSSPSKETYNLKWTEPHSFFKCKGSRYNSSKKTVVAALWLQTNFTRSAFYEYNFQWDIVTQLCRLPKTEGTNIQALNLLHHSILWTKWKPQ